MKKFKTLIALMLALALVIVAGCKSEPSSTDPTPDAATPSGTNGLETGAPEESATPDDVQTSPSLAPDNTVDPSNGGRRPPILPQADQLPQPRQTLRQSQPPSLRPKASRI